MMKFLKLSSLVLSPGAPAAAPAAGSAPTLQPANDVLEHLSTGSSGASFRTALTATWSIGSPAARGLAFAFPTETLHVEDDVARKLAGVKPAVFS
jgi:hypothetical protein